MYAFLLYPLAVIELVPRALLLACRAALGPQEPPVPDCRLTERNPAS